MIDPRSKVVSGILKALRAGSRLLASAAPGLVGAALLCGLARAQEGLPDMVFTAGTTTSNQLGQPWAYFLWQGTTPELLTGRVFAVYAKVGNAASASAYQRKAIVGLSADPLAIGSLLSRAANLGENLAKLDDDVTALFGSLVATNLSLPQKVSAVLRGATANADDYKNLLMLSRLHPGISLCLGSAYMEPMPSPVMTYEVRGFDPTRNLDLMVMGRVTIEAGAPVVLPPPGPLVEVPELSPKGHLNVKLRWVTPEALRRLSLLQFGFNVWRVPQAYAEAPTNQWHDPAHLPDPSTLRARWGADPTRVKRCNNLPILTSKAFSPQDVADFTADPKTAFYADDDGRFLPGYLNPGFTNGARFYYFVTARDLLGRDGWVSGGALVTLCDRLPPDAPPRVEVVNDPRYDPLSQTRNQRLKVIWTQPTNTTDEVLAGYYVYRWNDLDEMHQLAGDTNQHRISGLIPHANTQSLNSYVDDGPTSPVMPGDASKTFWYTVRTARTTAGCGTILSHHTPPTYGVLRDRTGPTAPILRAQIFTSAPQVEWVRPAADLQGQPPLTDVYRYRLVCTTADARLAWAEFLHSNPVLNPDPVSVGRINFSTAPSQVSLDYAVPRQGANAFYCRVGLADGRTALAATPADVGAPEGNQALRQLLFQAGVTAGYGYPADPSAAHESRPLGVATTACVKVEIAMNDATAREWRLYRRVDDGPLTLLRQETNAPMVGPTTFTYWDCAMPINAGLLCYFGQLFDQHGNPSPLVRMDDCIKVSGVLPTPTLFKIKSAGTMFARRMELKWFCSPYGVRRFLVFINGNLPPDQPANLVKLTLPDPVVGFTAFQTPHLGPGFGDGPEFQVTVNINPGSYHVFVAAWGLDGKWDLTKQSNIEDLPSWSDPTGTILAPGLTVPWPALDLPPVVLWPNVVAQRLSSTSHCVNGVGVRIGAFLLTEVQREPSGRPRLMTNNFVLVNHVYRDRQGKSLLPVALYRYQVPNAQYPTVSGNVVQVSPLLEDIAYENTQLPSPSLIVHDPFIDVCDDDPARPQLRGLYLLDTQPLTIGACYRYLLVRFKDNHEIEEVIPTNDVEVTR